MRNETPIYFIRATARQSLANLPGLLLTAVMILSGRPLGIGHILALFAMYTAGPVMMGYLFMRERIAQREREQMG